MSVLFLTFFFFFFAFFFSSADMLDVSQEDIVWRTIQLNQQWNQDKLAAP